MMRANIVVSRRAGFTLIELLIVVAIIAITLAGSMVVITGPMFERVRAENEEAFETGAGVFFSSLVQDAHSWQKMDMPSTGTLVFGADTPTTGAVTYAVNESGVLTRSAGDGGQVVKLIPGVEALTAEQVSTGSLYNVRLVAKIRGYSGGVTTVSRSMDVLVGQNGWTGKTF